MFLYDREKELLGESIRIIGIPWRSIKHHSGFWMRNLGFLFTGEFTASRHLGANGIPEICIFRAVLSLNII